MPTSKYLRNDTLIVHTSSTTCVLLSGGIGGAKLALGLDRVLPRGALTVIANTGDDFHHLGLAISPDIDTLMYTLAGVVNPDTGWGCRDETWQFMAALAQLGGETWFRLGDRDLATHVRAHPAPGGRRDTVAGHGGTSACALGSAATSCR